LKILLNAFNAGEVNPTLAGRVDLENLRKACAKCRNFIPNVLGGVFRRPPLLHVGMAAAPASAARLIPFNFSATTKFQIELGPHSMRFWRGDGSGVVGEPLTTPWGADDLDAVQFVQVNDVMFFSHPNYAPQRLIRFSDTDWRLADLFADLVAPSTPTIPGEPGKAVLEWWMNWGGTFPNSVASMQAVRTQAAFYNPATSSADITSLALPALPASGGKFMRRVLGILTVPTTGVWRFYYQGNDGICAFLFEDWVGGKLGAGEAYHDANLTAGTEYRLEVFSWNQAGTFSGSVAISGPGYAKAIVPSTLLRKRDQRAPVNELATVLKWAPMLDENIGSVKLAVSATTGAGVTMTATADTFKAGHVGSFWQIGHFRDTLSAELTFAVGAGSDQSGTSPEIRVKGRWEFLSVGLWAGNVYLEEKNAAGDWDIVRRWTGAKDRNVTASGDIEGEAVLRIRASGIDPEAASGADQPRFMLEAVESLVYGLVKVTAVASAISATVDVISTVYATTATSAWSEGAWSNERGFPRSLALHEGRLWFAGSRTEPQKLWSSVSGDYLNFQQSTLADGAIVLQISAQEANPILWMASQSGLIIGTQGDEWLIDGGTEGLRPDNASAKRQSRYGSEPFQALLAGAVVLFIQRGGQVLSEYVFQFEEQNYVAPDVTKLVGHLTREGIRSVAYAQHPDPTLWAVTFDGQLLSCTYQRPEQVVAWATHPTAGTVESVSVVYGATRAADEVWIVVERGGTRRIERLDPDHWNRLHAGTGTVWHADAAVLTTGTDLETVNGLSHLEGMTVQILTDSGEHSDRVVRGGAVALETPSAWAAVGLGCPAQLQPMPIEVQLDDGTAQGRKFHSPRFSLRLYKSQGGRYTDAPGDPMYPIPFRTANDDQNEPVPPFSGIIRLQASGRYRDEFQACIESNGPLPLNIIGIIPNLEIHGS
jgi:hypothetical protein